MRKWIRLGQIASSARIKAPSGAGLLRG